MGEALMLARCGVSYVGLPLRLPVHRPDVTDEEARAIVAALAGSGAQAVLITYLSDAEEALALCRYLGVSGLQLHGNMPLAHAARLRAAAPELFVIKSLVIGTAPEADILAQAQAHAPLVDAFLTDTFDPASGASGATGKVHDWAVSARLARALPRPLILAGGLDADNVAEAIRTVQPGGVDAHTGLEDTQGRKDEALLRRFVTQARAAFAALGAAGLAKDCDSA
ncbi:phosphoribosylanthranilate isomerase [Humidesulfovibrio mexicanus]|uniref:N-(5'-phosphoribosyl)anthranilate isomerase n=1 Tax=Humidesulfovibrio mexicanus TaxID=147047 RepID=A0A238YTT9_9BACT|nr:phosphoribosylanthranilate isomerase [Humidesulfovibrio mexicanus]